MVFQTSSWLTHLYASCTHESLRMTSRPLEDGDIINIDITVYLDGLHGDTSQTFLVGEVVGNTSCPL